MNKMNVSSFSAFKVVHCPVADFSHSAEFIASLLRAESSSYFPLGDENERANALFVSNAFVLANETQKFLKKYGFTTVFYVDVFNRGSLREFRSSIDGIMKLGFAGLISRLEFSLKVESLNGVIFSARCDTLNEIPKELPEEVVKAILSTNPDMDAEKILDAVEVTIKANIPCVELVPVGIDLENQEKDFMFFTNDPMYACSVVDGYSFSFTGMPKPYTAI